MARSPTKARTPGETPKRTDQRVSRYDVYRKELRHQNVQARSERQRLDLEIAEAQANLEALIAERNDWHNIELDTDFTIQAEAARPQIEGQAHRPSPQLTERKRDDEQN